MQITIFSLPQRIVYSHLVRGHARTVLPNYMLGGRRWDIAVPDLKMLFVLSIGVENPVTEGREEFEHEGEIWLVLKFDGSRFMDGDPKPAALNEIEDVLIEKITELMPENCEEDEFEWEDGRFNPTEDRLLLPPIAFLE